jgi:anti-anti-sigma regulatory factor
MGQTIHELQGTLRAGDAAGLCATLADALSIGDVRVATSGLTSVESAIVQVLLSALRTARQLERNLHIEIPDGGALAAMRDRLALDDALGVLPEDVGTA